MDSDDNIVWIDTRIFKRIVLINDTEEQPVWVKIKEKRKSDVINILLRGKSIICCCNLIKTGAGVTLGIKPCELTNGRYQSSERRIAQFPSAGDHPDFPGTIITILDNPLPPEILMTIGRTVPFWPTDIVSWEYGYLLYEKRILLIVKNNGKGLSTCSSKVRFLVKREKMNSFFSLQGQQSSALDPPSSK